MAMSTAQPVDPLSSAAPVVTGAPNTAPGGEPDEELIRETRQQIRSLVAEIQQLSRSDLSIEDFYDEFLRRVISALAAVGGAVWTLEDDGALRLQYQVNLSRTQVLQDPEKKNRHQLLLRKVIATEQPQLLLPQSGTADDEEAGNPTDFLLIVGVLQVEERVAGLVEIFQRAGGGPTTQRGYLRFLLQMCELASSFITNRRLRQFQDQQDLWGRLESFLAAIHNSLNTRRTAYTIANEGRQISQCDRMSVAAFDGRRCHIEAVSGLDNFDRRAADIRRLNKLTTAVVKSGVPLWHSEGESELPPQLEETMQQYLDDSHSKTIGIIPLTVTDNESGSEQKKPVGALVVELLRDARVSESLNNRSQLIAQHAASALHNAYEHNNIFLMPVWRSLGKAKWIIQARTLPKTLTALIMIVASIVAMCVIPADFKLAATGKLVPADRQDIFAPMSGVVTEVPVAHGDPVNAKDVLVRMRNTDLNVQLTTQIGRKTATEEQIRSAQRALLDNDRLTVIEQNRLSGDLMQLRKTLESIDRNIALLNKKQKQLTIVSPANGEVVTWQVGGRLRRRPVQRGQLLLSVVDPASDWELELHMPEKRMGHLSDFKSTTESPLQVTFFLKSHAGRTFKGTVVEVERTAHVQPNQENSVVIRVAVDRDDLPDLRSNTTVVAKIHCGRKAIGYVWLHEVVETIRSRVLFWL